MMILSERSPLEALESVFRRCAYVLIPFSIVLIKYFPQLGRQYNYWSGELMWTGVATQKNSLGQLCAFSVFFLFWAAFRKWRLGELLINRSQTFADVLVFSIGLLLLRGPGTAYSATSIVVFVVGITLLLLLYRMERHAIKLGAYLKAFVIGFTLIFLFFIKMLLPDIVSLLGRSETLTGRIDIWNAVMDIASQNPWFGVGYGGFWGLKNDASVFWMSQAHNGYLGVYLDVGIVGIIVLFAFLMAFCGKIRRELNYLFDWGVFGCCFLFMMLLNNYSEDNFLKTSFLWSSTVFLTVVFSSPVLDKTGD
jgi:O-antigen ligase